MRAPLKTLLVAAAAAFSLAVALAAWRTAERQQESEARAVFEFRVREFAQALGGRMLDYEQVLRGAVGLLAASREVTAAEWATYVGALQLDASYPGIQGVAYAATAGARMPVRYIEPMARGNEQVRGVDLMREPGRRAAIERARDAGEPVLTGRVSSLSDKSARAQPAFVLFLPVYRGGAVPASLAERRARFAAVVYATFRAPDLFLGTIGQPQGLQLRLFDASDADAPQLLYEDERASGESRYARTETLVVRGRTWRLEARSRPAFEALVAGDRARVVLSAGIALSVLFTALVWSLLNTRERAGELARGMVAAGEERDRFRSAVDRHWDTMLMVDADRMRIVYANEGACRSLGYSREELIGQPAAMVFADRDDASLAREYAWLAAGEVAEIERGSFRRNDGSTLPVEISRQFLQTASGRFVLGVARDITARLEAERSLRDSEARLALALESSGLALFDWDVQSNLVHLGKEWQLMLGGEAMATVTPIQKLEQLVHPDDLPALRAQLRKLLAGETESYRVEHRVRTLGGQWKWIESVAKVSGRDASGRALRVTGTNADITARKAVAELKNAFIAAVSHELRTPLTGIVTSLDLLKDGSAGELPEQARKFVDIAYGNGERLQALIDDILDLERVDTGRLRLEMRPLAAHELLAKAVTLNAPYAERYGARIVTRASGAELRVLADEDRLQQVLANLISNAAKHSPSNGEITLAAEKQGERLLLSVADQGPGIPDEFKARIFGRFEQADESKPGTGLGLAISKALVEKMGGEIRFDSAAGGGTVFFVELPLAR